MNLLIPYVKLPNHNDPLFQEFTYGDLDQRARKLRNLTEGDRLFFHTTIRGKKCITAYYVVSRALDTKNVVEDHDLVDKFKNPHIARYREDKKPPVRDDVIVFGDPITSKVLTTPLTLDRKLVERLSLRVPFPKGRLESQAIASATRSWRSLTDKDVKVLRSAIRRCDDAADDDGMRLAAKSMLTTEEVSQVIERHIEGLLAKHPNLLGHAVTSVKRQVETDDGRIDLLLENKAGQIIVVEVKLHRIGRDAVKQLRDYMAWARKGRKGREVLGVIVCEGVLPAFVEDLAKLKDIKVFCYGWQLRLRQWS